jgi:hypothetical protein
MSDVHTRSEWDFRCEVLHGGLYLETAMDLLGQFDQG